MFLVGMGGFEPPTSCSQSRRADQAALHPEIGATELRPLQIRSRIRLDPPSPPPFRRETILTHGRISRSAISFLEFFELVFKASERLGAVADLIFHIRPELG